MKKYVCTSFWYSSFFKNSRKVGYLQDAGLEEVHSKPLVFYISLFLYYVTFFISIYSIGYLKNMVIIETTDF